MKVVFDWDGVFNNQTEFLSAHLGIPTPNHYHSHRATNLTSQQQDALQESYSDIPLYCTIPMVPEFHEVLHLPYGPYICSCNMNREMLEYKRRTVYAAYKGFPADHLILLDGREKPAVEDADVVVEDSIDYLEKYDDSVVKILIDHVYNRYATGNFVRLPSLGAALGFIRRLKI